MFGCLGCADFPFPPFYWSFFPKIFAGDDNFSEVFSDGSDLPVNNLDVSPETKAPSEALEPPATKAPEPEVKRMGTPNVGGQRGERDGEDVVMYL